MIDDTRAKPAAALVRPANALDNDALLSLVRRCPMSADISLIVERDPDFFALGRARGDADTFVAEIEGAIVGCLSCWRRDAWFKGSPAEICYIGDLRVAPEHRRRGVAWQLAITMRDHLVALPIVPCLLATGAGNTAVAPVASAFGSGGVPIARFTSWQLLPLVPLKITSGLDIGAAEHRDEADLCRLFDDFYRCRDFSPIFGGGGFGNLLARSRGAQLSDYLVARRRGRIAAAIGVWDASLVKRTRVVGMPSWLQVICGVGRAASRLASLPPFPKQGELLHFRYIRHAAYRQGDTEALKALVRRAVNGARARGEHFVLYTCADNDPLSQAVTGAPRLSFHYRIASTNYWPEAPALKSPSQAAALYFDDAALA